MYSFDELVNKVFNIKNDLVFSNSDIQKYIGIFKNINANWEYQRKLFDIAFLDRKVCPCIVPLIYMLLRINSDFCNWKKTSDFLIKSGKMSCNGNEYSLEEFIKARTYQSTAGVAREIDVVINLLKKFGDSIIIKKDFNMDLSNGIDFILYLATPKPVRIATVNVKKDGHGTNLHNSNRKTAKNKADFILKTGRAWNRNIHIVDQNCDGYLNLLAKIKECLNV